MRRPWVITFMLLPVLLVTVGAKPPKPMYEPRPIPIPEDASVEQVAGAIEAALGTSGWTVDETTLAEDGTNEILSTLHIRVHTLTMKLRFDNEKIRIEYVDSTNLGYEVHKEKGKLIHRNCTRWLKSLEAQLKTSLALPAKLSE